MGAWPSVEEGFTTAQLRIFPSKAPKFTLQYDKEKFRAAVEDFSKVINDKLGAIVVLSLNAAGSRPIVTKEQGRSATDALQKLQEITALEKEIDTSLFGNRTFFDQFPRYKTELMGLMPNETQGVLVAYRAALFRLTNALMVVRQAEKHSEDGELFEYSAKSLDFIAEEFFQATGDVKRWFDAVNVRIDLMVKVI